MRNALRVLAFDIVAPLAAVAALAMVGIILGWPQWWVAVFSVLAVLVVQAMAVNFYLLRRDQVTVGTDDDGAALRLAVVAVSAAALIAAVALGYTRWTVPDRTLAADNAEVVRIATEVSEATFNFVPSDPVASINRAADLMRPDYAEEFRKDFGAATADLVRKRISAQAQTVSAGVEALGPAAASVAVIMRGTQSAPGAKPSTATLALRISLVKEADKWLVADVAPISGATE